MCSVLFGLTKLTSTTTCLHVRLVWMQATGYTISFTFEDTSSMTSLIQFDMGNNLTQLYDGCVFQRCRQ